MPKPYFHNVPPPPGCHICERCQQLKQVEAFSHYHGKPRTYCKQCDAEYARSAQGKAAQQRLRNKIAQAKPAPPPQPENTLTPVQVAAQLNVTRPYVSQLYSAGKLTGSKQGKLLFIDAESVNLYLAESPEPRAYETAPDPAAVAKFEAVYQQVFTLVKNGRTIQQACKKAGIKDTKVFYRRITPAQKNALIGMKMTNAKRGAAKFKAPGVTDYSRHINPTSYEDEYNAY